MKSKIGQNNPKTRRKILPGEVRSLIGFLGTTGAGKDTCIQIFQKLFPHFTCCVIRLAEPLYQVQKSIYQVCGIQIGEDTQDGILLNFLGKHMRSINPDVLTHAFAKNLETVDPSTDFVLCSDVRPMDAPFLKKLGFTLLYIDTDKTIALERRRKRGDLSLGNAEHNTETGISSEMYDYRITNNGSLKELEDKFRTFIEEFRDTDRP